MNGKGAPRPGAPFRTLLTVEDLLASRDPSWVLLDARHALDDRCAGRVAYDAGHLPGARFVDVDEDASGPVAPGRTGRRPLPSPDRFAEAIRRWGITAGSQVVVYDWASGADAAARVWVLLKWIGVADVAVLDGGFTRWVAEGGALEAASPPVPPSAFVPRIDPRWVATTEDVTAALTDCRTVLVDARSEEVYRGAASTFDAVRGHIPGARCLPVYELSQADGRLLPPEDLQRLYDGAGVADAGQARIAYCGSGIWAAQHVLAMACAGIPGARLYVGSWSEWTADRTLPVQT